MNVCDLRQRLVEGYARYTRSFIKIADPRIIAKVDGALDDGALWPDPLIQLNLTFEPGGTIDELVADGTLHPECRKIFRIDKSNSLERPCLDASWMLHLDVFRPQLNAVLTGRSRPDLVGETTGGAWVARGGSAWLLRSQTQSQRTGKAGGERRGVFDELAFAITDWSADHFFIGPFRRTFGG